MTENKSWICYTDDDGKRREGFVDILESNETFVKFKTDKNTITIPFSRIVKIKEGRQDGV